MQDVWVKWSRISLMSWWYSDTCFVALIVLVMVVCHIYHVFTRKQPSPREEKGEMRIPVKCFLHQGGAVFLQGRRRISCYILLDWSCHLKAISEPRGNGVFLAWADHGSFHCHLNEVRAQPGSQGWQLCNRPSLLSGKEKQSLSPDLRTLAVVVILHAVSTLQLTLP